MSDEGINVRERDKRRGRIQNVAKDFAPFAVLSLNR